MAFLQVVTSQSYHFQRERHVTKKLYIMNEINFLETKLYKRVFYTHKKNYLILYLKVHISRRMNFLGLLKNKVRFL